MEKSTGVILLALLLHAACAAVIPGFEECVLNDNHYSIGQEFHPVVEVNGTELEAVCFKCVCLETAIAQCEHVICPPSDCDEPIRINGECCEICLPPPTLTTDPSCNYSGLKISDGDVFRPSSMVDNFTSTQSTRSECEECICTDTEITCYDISNKCPTLSCNDSEAMYLDGKCCKQCPAPTHAPVSGPGCFDFNGGFIPEGEWWYPTLPDYGVVTCVNCTCQDSLPRCARLPCPEVPPCGPDDPIEDVVVCCPKCTPVVPSIPTEAPTISLDDNTTNSSTPTTPVFTPDITACESPYIYKIYRNLFHDSLALHNLDTSLVEVYNWTTMVSPEGPVLDKELTKLNATEFISESDGSFVFVGWTIDRRVRGLSNKQAKRERIEACTQDCARMVTNMLRPVYTLSETLVCGR